MGLQGLEGFFRRLGRLRLGLYHVGFIFLVSPKGHQIYTLTNIQKEPYIHSPKAEIETLLQIGLWKV